MVKVQELKAFISLSSSLNALLHLFHPDAGPEWGGAVGAGLVEFTQRGSGGHGELPQRPQHHLPPGTLAPDQPRDGQDRLHLPGPPPGSE